MTTKKPAKKRKVAPAAGANQKVAKLVVGMLFRVMVSVQIGYARYSGRTCKLLTKRTTLETRPTMRKPSNVPAAKQPQASALKSKSNLSTNSSKGNSSARPRKRVSLL